MEKYATRILAFSILYLIFIILERDMFTAYFRGKQCIGRIVGYAPAKKRLKTEEMFWNCLVLIEDENRNIVSESFKCISVPIGKVPNPPCVYEEDIEYIKVIFDEKSERCLIGSKLFLAVKFLVINLIVAICFVTFSFG